MNQFLDGAYRTGIAAEGSPDTIKTTSMPTTTPMGAINCWVLPSNTVWNCMGSIGAKIRNPRSEDTTRRTYPTFRLNFPFFRRTATRTDARMAYTTPTTFGTLSNTIKYLRFLLFSNAALLRRAPAAKKIIETEGRINHDMDHVGDVEEESARWGGV